MSNQFHFLIREITVPQLIYDILNLTSRSSYNRGFNNPVNFASFVLLNVYWPVNLVFKNWSGVITANLLYLKSFIFLVIIISISLFSSAE